MRRKLFEFVPVFLVSSSLAFALMANPVHAQSASPAAVAASAAAPSGWTDGEVRKVDKSSRKVTLKHGAIDNLGMDAMTMVFKAPASVPIDGLKVGDKVRFSADIRDGALTVTRIEPAR